LLKDYDNDNELLLSRRFPSLSTILLFQALSLFQSPLSLSMDSSVSAPAIGIRNIMISIILS
jgi:hypothetical protein